MRHTEFPGQFADGPLIRLSLREYAGPPRAGSHDAGCGKHSSYHRAVKGIAPFGRAQKQEVEEVVGRGAAAVESILADGVEKSMAVFNRRAGGLNTEEE